MPSDRRDRRSRAGAVIGRLTLRTIVAERRRRRRLDVDRSRRGGWAGSCRRSRAGSAARGGPGRPSRPAAPPGAARSRSSASSAARTVRPVKSTSSTSTTVRAVEVDRDVGDGLGQDRSQADVVAVEGHVEGADGTATRPRSARALVPSSCASGTPPVCRPTRTTPLEPVVALDDLVGHPPRRPGARRRGSSPGSGQQKRPRRGASDARSRSAKPSPPVRAGLTGPASRSERHGSSVRSGSRRPGG